MSNNFDTPIILNSTVDYFGFGRTDPNDFSDFSRIHFTAADPSGTLLAPLGSLALQGVGAGALWINTDGATAWSQFAAAGAVDLQAAYDASPAGARRTVLADGATEGVEIRQNAANDALPIFSVANNLGTLNYLDVNGDVSPFVATVNVRGVLDILGASETLPLLDITGSTSNFTGLNFASTMTSGSLTQHGLRSVPAFQPAGAVTNLFSFNTSLSLQLVPANVANASCVFAELELGFLYSGTVASGAAFRAGGVSSVFSTGTVTTWSSFLAEDNLGAPVTNNRAFTGEMSFGAGNYNLYMSGTAPNYMEGNLGVGTDTVQARLDVNQSASGAGIPVLRLHQLDVSEEMIFLDSVIAAGNTVQPVGAQVMTPTHFVRVTLAGGLVRYMEVGTIA